MADRKEIVDKVTAFVNRKYNGDWKEAFEAHDEDGDGLMSTDEVAVVLAKSGIGYRATRWLIASQIIDAMDADADGKVSFDEFAKITDM